MRAVIFACVLGLGGCAGSMSPFPVRPSTVDAKPAAWMIDEAAQQKEFWAFEHHFECDPRDWARGAEDPSWHPECAPKKAGAR
jgi:hypothetical protein